MTGEDWFKRASKLRAIAAYASQCPHCAGIDVTSPSGVAARAVPCPGCGAASVRVFSAPMSAHTPVALSDHLQRTCQPATCAFRRADGRLHRPESRDHQERQQTVQLRREGHLHAGLHQPSAQPVDRALRAVGHLGRRTALSRLAPGLPAGLPARDRLPDGIPASFD